MSNFPETEFSGRDFRFNPVNVRNESIFVYITDQIIKGYCLTFHCDGLWKWFKINHKDIVILTDAHIYINKFVTFIWYLYCLKNMFLKNVLFLVIIVHELTLLSLHWFLSIGDLFGVLNLLRWWEITLWPCHFQNHPSKWRNSDMFE